MQYPTPALQWEGATSGFENNLPPVASLLNFVCNILHKNLTLQVSSETGLPADLRIVQIVHYLWHF